MVGVILPLRNSPLIFIISYSSCPSFIVNTVILAEFSLSLVRSRPEVNGVSTSYVFQLLVIGLRT